MALPRFFTLSKYGKNKYLRYVDDDPEVHGFNKFDGHDVVSPYARYEVVQSKTTDGIVHIRCCYNNKYWVRWSPDHRWIVSGANEEEEDKSKWSCTLFEPSFLDDKTVRLRHVQLGFYATSWEGNNYNDGYNVCLHAAGKEIDIVSGAEVFKVVDLESLLVLPKRVAFKGDTGAYLRAFFSGGNNYLQFSGDDLGDQGVFNQVFVTPDGSVRVKSDHFGKFWSRGASDWIWADSEEDENAPSNTFFLPVKADDIGGIALHNLGNKKFCKRFTYGQNSCLSACDDDISQYSILNLEEPVVSRDIFDVKYHVKNARIYEKRTVVMAQGEAHNMNKSSSPSDMVVKLSYTVEKPSRTWNGRVFFKANHVQTAVRAGIPSISEGNMVTVVNENPGLHKWGETEESTICVQEIPFMIAVPGQTTVKVRLVATKAWCDVPFSYTQCDTMTNGEKFSDTMVDGLYTGANFFDFKYDIKFYPS